MIIICLRHASWLFAENDTVAGGAVGLQIGQAIGRIGCAGMAPAIVSRPIAVALRP